MVAPSQRVPGLACGRWPLASFVPFEGRTLGCASCRSVGGAGSSLQFKGHTIANPPSLPWHLGGQAGELSLGRAAASC